MRILSKAPVSVVLPDVPDPDDKLDFAPYANTLRDIILNPNTQTPLTIGIFGSWGSGKTSLMKMIEAGLKRAAPRQGESGRQTYPVWFNAWLYSKEETLWRALVMQVLTGVRRIRGLDTEARAELNDLADQLCRAAGPLEVGRLSITAADLLKENSTGSARIELALQHGLDFLENIANARQQGELAAAQTLRHQVQRATAVLEQERIESLERFQKQFEALVKKYVKPRGCLVIFVDDLDRCLPDKAVEVLEAIKLFLDVPGCIFILGIDREVIERGIRLRYGELGGAGHRGTLPLLVSEDMLDDGAARYRAFLQDLLAEDEDIIDGGRYLEKIIQIPFVLPPIGPEAMGRFTARLAPNLPDPECGIVFAQGLEPNPRQVKRAINIFTLLWELSRNKPGLAPLIKPVRLAKLVVLQQRHPDLYEMLRQDPGQLVAWERAFRQERDMEGFREWERSQGRPETHERPLPQEVEAYELLPALKSFLTMHPLTGKAAAETNFVDLTADEVRTYVFLTRTVKESVPEAEPSPAITEEWIFKAPLGALSFDLMEGMGSPPVEEYGVSIEAGISAERRGFITGRVYSGLAPLSEQATSEGKFPTNLRRIVLDSLAMAGSSIYAEAASDPKRRAELKALLEEPTLIRISGARNEAQIPWETVYDRPRPYGLVLKAVYPEQSVEVDVEGFWGFKHVIERPLVSGLAERAAPPPEIPVSGLPLVTLGLDIAAPRFGEVRETFQQWADEGRIDLVGVDYPSDLRDVLAKRPADLVVIHGRGGIEGGETWLGFGKERLTRRMLESWKTGERGSALFFLDVTAGLGQSSDWWAWLDLFSELGAGGVVAPMVAPHASWSSDFLTRFMEILLGGKAAGAALRDARREFFEETGNPLGLFYAHFGPAAQRLVRPDEDEAEEG